MPNLLLQFVGALEYSRDYSHELVRLRSKTKRLRCLIRKTYSKEGTGAAAVRPAMQLEELRTNEQNEKIALLRIHMCVFVTWS